MASEQEPPHISMKQAIELARWKPAKNQTRNDLLVYGGWLTSRWEWSRDVDVSLDQAIANSRRLGEDVRIVGNPKPADRKKVRGRKPLPIMGEQPKIKAPERPPLPPLELMQPAPAPPVKEGSAPEDGMLQPPELPTRAGSEEPLVRAAPSAPRFHESSSPPRPDGALASHLLLQRFLIAASLCSIALFLGYYRLAGTLFVSILLIADAFFIVATSLLALRNRRAFGGRRRNTPVGARDAQQGAPQAVG